MIKRGNLVNRVRKPFAVGEGTSAEEKHKLACLSSRTILSGEKWKEAPTGLVLRGEKSEGLGGGVGVGGGGCVGGGRSLRQKRTTLSREIPILKNQVLIRISSVKVVFGFVQRPLEERDRESGPKDLPQKERKNTTKKKKKKKQEGTVVERDCVAQRAGGKEPQKRRET